MHPKNKTNLSSNKYKIKLITTPNIIVNTIVDATDLLAFFSFFYPSLKLKLAAHPFPIKPATALQKITIGNITLVAAFPKYPTP